MAYLLDLENGITNEALSYWVENFGLTMVSFETGAFQYSADLHIPFVSTLEAKARKLAGLAKTEPSLLPSHLR